MTRKTAKGAALTALAAAVAACSPHPSADEAAIDLAKQAVANTFRDPGSAQFRDVRLNGSRRNICGEVNAKNGFGGYVGFVPFAYDVEKKTPLIAADSSGSKYASVEAGAVRDVICKL